MTGTNNTTPTKKSDVLELLSRFGSKGIRLQLKGTNIKVNAQNKPIDTNILTEIKIHKEEIIEFLKNHSTQDSVETSIHRAPEKEYYPLSSPQKRLFILQEMMSGNITYNMPIALKLTGKMEKKKLDRTFRFLIERHESLRTSFHLQEDSPVQKVHSFHELEFNVESVDPNNIDKNMGGFLRPFDLAKAPLLRVGFAPLEKKPGEHEDSYLLLMDIHHIVSDGTSMNILVSDFARLYDGQALPELKIQYKDFVQWQQGETQQADLKRSQDFWLQQFAGELPQLDLPLDFPRPMTQSFSGNIMEFQLDRKLTQTLNSIALDEEVTLYMLLLSTYTILLAKLSSQDDIIVGTPVAGRLHADLNSVIGMFINTLSLRNKPTPDKSFRNYLQQVKLLTLNSFSNQEYPYEELVEQLNVQRDTARNPLFDTLFVLQNMEPPSLELPGLTVSSFQEDYIQEISKFDLTFSSFESDEQLNVAMEYCTDLFKSESIERFFAFYRRILEQVVTNMDITIGKIEIMDDREKNKILIDFNKIGSKVPADNTIPQLFLQQTEKNPHSVALIGPMKQSKGNGESDFMILTYRELNALSSRYARLLKDRGVGTGFIVALMLERSIHMIAVILAVLRTGAAYLPIEIACPSRRIEYMLKDSGAKILITSRNNEADLECPEQIVFLEDAPIKDEDCDGSNQVAPGDIAYIIYTSGTTGKPKGVTTSHANVLRVVDDTNYIDFQKEDRVMQLSNYAFDGSVFDIYGALVNGATLIVVDKPTLKAVDRLATFIEVQAISIFFVTTALFNTLVDVKIQCLNGVRKILFGGERVSTEHSVKAFDYLGKNRIIHVYGPTETTVYASFYPLDHVGNSRTTIPIGRPLTGTSIYILDRETNPVPIGVKGEIYIGGTGVARGYLNRPELSHERFLNVMGKRLYRSGDQGRWLTDGNIEFIGRMDQQVKLRGFRIELGEIESSLLKHPHIKDTVVLAHGGFGSDKYLCAYLVAQDVDSVPDREVLNRFLASTLPEYMIPSFFVFLSTLPLTANGKLDIPALPLPETGTPTVEYVAPRDEVEEQLIAIWYEVLFQGRRNDLPLIGIDDHFFHLGGNSLKATILKAKMKSQFQIEIPLADMFATPTVSGMADILRAVLWVNKSQEENLELEMEEMVL